MGLFAGTQWDMPAHCEKCGRLEKECDCPPPVPVARDPSKQRLTVRVEKRKAGRVVTVIGGLAEDDPGRGELLKRIKNACGAGGSIEADHLIVQGDQLEKTIKLLEEIGYRIKR